MNSLTTKGKYQVILGCDLCEVAWASPIIEDTLETVFAMNEKASCPECGACRHHEDPSLQVALTVLKIVDLNNEYAIVT